MELEDIKDRYKILPMAARIGVAFVIGILPIVYIFLDEGSTLSDQLTDLQARESQARATFESHRTRKANLPKLEEDLAFTEEQLNKAKRLLPETFRVEEVLQKVATTARDVGVSLESFKPLEEIKKDIGYPTVEIPIQAEISGRFGDIGNFMDQILRSEMTLFVKSIAITPVPIESRPADTLGAGQQNVLLAKEMRQHAKEKAALMIVAYRSQTNAEIATLQTENLSNGTAPAGAKANQPADDKRLPPSGANNSPPGGSAE